MLTTDGEYWRGHRRAVQPAFQKNAILGIVPNIVTATTEMLDEWETKAARDEPVDLMTEMLRLTLITLSRSLFAYDIKPSSRILKHIVDDVVEVMFRRGSASEMMPSWLPTVRKRKIARIHQVFDGIVADVRENYSRTGEVR
ncbi:cytochrome P450 [Streptomyces sp. M10(2022)]